ncbi:efflux RND transporter permease subunit, partial [Candidatus Sumerlaeota bacterium]|nr:efflux RND transporter permease subunit [Candidatus Sumerlaeota bacterium]
MRLPETSVKRPVATLMVFVAIFIMSVVSVFFLKIDLLPEIEPPAISIIIPYPGASASDVESDVTKYIEDQMTGVNNLDSLYSISKDNLSVVTCKFTWGTNLDVAINDVRDKLDMAKYDVKKHAPDADEPIVFKFASATMPILVLSITATESYK